ncbi:MAG: acyl-CoA thioesterase [Geobacteraceae bacterium]|nr:acyl-CoA thioesterase [Geobacteraceae bacterium]
MTRPSDTSRSLVLPLGSDPDLHRRYMVVNEPLQGNFRFGLMLEVLDKLAEETALDYVRRSYPGARVVTAAIDNIFIRNAADVTRDLAFHARINQVGRSSVEVGIRVEHPAHSANSISGGYQGGEEEATQAYREVRRGADDEANAGRRPKANSLHIASCYFTMVARSGSGEGATSLALPPLEYGDDLERERLEKALASREAYRREQAAAQEPPSREEYALLSSLHKAQEEPGFTGLLAGRLVTESWERMYPEQENVPRTIFGGYLIRRAYELSAICAELVAPDRPVIVAVNRINFFSPVLLDDKLHFTSRVVYTGQSSIAVEANIERISRDRTSKALSNSCLFTFVNVDRELHPRPVPPVFPTTYAEDARYLAAHRQHEAYLTGKREGKFHH